MLKLITFIFIGTLWVNIAFAQEVSRENIDAAVKENDKANIAMMKKDYKAAYEHLKKAIELDPTNSTFLNSAAFMAMHEGDYDGSVELLKKAIELDTEKFGADHMNVASVINNLASVYSKMGNKEEAIKNYQQAYDMAKKSLGPHHPQTEMIKGLLDKENDKE